MIDYPQYKKNKDIPTIKTILCPACNKKRLGKYTNTDGSIDIANTETVEVRGVERYLEVCQFCVNKYRIEDEKFVFDNMRKLSKAFMKDEDKNKESDHKDFSLN